MIKAPNAGINLMWLGLYCYAYAVREHASINDGLVLFVLSIVAIVWMAYENIRETDLGHGLAGSALQLALFFPVALYSLPLLLIAMAIVLFASFRAGPAWLVDRYAAVSIPHRRSISCRPTLQAPHIGAMPLGNLTYSN
ncbi:hypothetical protein AYM40_12085 [Paraburkholderia phytofirmans OLGA172]|uniref:Uncharacterized protein n=1 Tax=Paraburkholderia phytofirmans OLGA172 TaxID=1417228 RepID=A0A160FKP3_9BURK|nr:hypothetical protein [Paraburkholderia phytofirmans]ANB73020.1 hypothetical protein AYM40_12085 [Paraburkholderia phytofirmans OLGA172]